MRWLVASTLLILAACGPATRPRGEGLADRTAVHELDQLHDENAG
jgi:hypothetical protein